MEAASERDLIAVDIRLPRATLRALILDTSEGDGDVEARSKTACASFLLSSHHRWRHLWGGLRLNHACLNILFELYLSHHAERQSDISSLSIASGAPFSSGLRHVDRLVSMGLARRELDANDKRRWLVVIEDDALNQIEAWLDEELGHISKDLIRKI
jgi:DNA-binding MarR family transcriptional regulator